MEKVREIIKKVAVRFCVLFTAVTLLSAFISEGVETDAYAVMGMELIRFDIMFCAVISVLSVVTEMLRRGILRRWSFVGQNMLLYPIFLGATIIMLAPEYSAYGMSAGMIAAIFTVLYAVFGAVALCIHRCKRKQYTARALEYIASQTCAEE